MEYVSESQVVRFSQGSNATHQFPQIAQCTGWMGFGVFASVSLSPTFYNVSSFYSRSHISFLSSNHRLRALFLVLPQISRESNTKEGAALRGGGGGGSQKAEFPWDDHHHLYVIFWSVRDMWNSTQIAFTLSLIRKTLSKSNEMKTNLVSQEFPTFVFLFHS